MGAEKTLSITVVYSPRPREVQEVALTVSCGCTVAQALQRSGILSGTQSGDITTLTVGIWGNKVGNGHVLHDKDRLEVYRALTVDPKEARRERFARQGAKKAAGLFAQRRVGAKAGY